MTSAECVWEFPFAGGCVLVRPEVDNLYILNPAAALAWYLFRAGKSIEDAAEEFALTQNIPRDVAARDLTRTWKDWENTLLAPLSSVPISSFVDTFPADLSNCFSRDYRLHDKNIRVILHDPDLTAEIAPRIESHLTVSGSSPDATLLVSASENGYHVFSGTTCIATAEDSASARVLFLQEFARVAEAKKEWAAILHAAACGTEDKCIIFPAASHSGKTTLAAALVHAGMTFYADDSVVLQAESLKIPAMPFAMMIREGSWPVVSERFPRFQSVPTHERGGENVRFFHPANLARECARPAAIVFSQWNENGGTDIESLDPFDALVRLTNSGFWVAHDRSSIASFLNLLLSLPIYQMSYSSLDEATEFVKHLLVA